MTAVSADLKNTDKKQNSKQLKTSEDHSGHDQEWSWTTLADATPSRHTPAFTKDARFFFIAVANAISIYSRSTGSLLSTFKAHQQPITSLLLNPSNPFQLFSVSLDGVMKIWDFTEPRLLATLDIGSPITHICAHPSISTHVFLACNFTPKKQKKRHTQKQQSMIIRVALKTTVATSRDPIQKSTQLIHIGKTRAVAGLAISPSGNWLIVIGGHKVYIAKASELKTGFTKFVSPEELTCLAVHPTEDWFATGDSIGQMRLWYCLQQGISFEKIGAEKRAQTTTFHWHAHAVRSLAFTPNGAYLLSGGEESVLVIWQLHSGKKEFIPRLGAPINTITVVHTDDGNRSQDYLLGLADGTFIFVSSTTMSITRTISCVKFVHSSYWHSDHTAPLASHSRTGNLILPSSHPSFLQVYAPDSSQFVTEIEVCPSNRISPRDEQPIHSPRVELVAVSKSGKWMATVDMRDGEGDGFGFDINLKLWEWSDRDKSWDLNTRIERPHGSKRVLSLEFHPTADDENSILLTTGQDSNIKTWRSLQVNRGKSRERYWANRSVFQYREQMPTKGAWSNDGSIIAVNHGHVITLWDFSSNALCKTLACIDIKEIFNMAFLGQTGRLLCATGTRRIVVWDLVTGKVIFTHKVMHPLTQLAAHPNDETFVTCQQQSGKQTETTPSTVIIITNPRSTNAISHRTVPFRIRQCIWYPHTSNNSTAFRLVGITGEGKVVAFGENIQQQEVNNHPTRPLDHFAQQGLDRRPTLFQDIFGKSALVDPIFNNRSENLASDSDFLVNAAVHVSGKARGKNGMGLLDGPSHLLPSMQTLFLPLMETMLERRDQETVTNDDTKEKGEPKDVDMAECTESTPKNEWRKVSEEENAMMVELFKEEIFAIRPTAMAPPTSRKLNRIANGTSKGKVLANGSTPTVKTLTNGKAVTQTTKPPLALPPLVPEALEPLISIGRKRKQSMMT